MDGSIMAGTIKIDTIQSELTTPTVFKNSSGTEIGKLCRSFVNFNGSTPAISSSFNISSLTRNATGQFTLAFSSSFTDQYYSGSSTGTSSANYITAFDDTNAAPTSSAARVITRTGGFVDNNSPYSMFSLNR